MPLARVGEWRGRSVEVTAHLIPRFLWMTASIDVYIDSECVLKTGGQLKSPGESMAQFYDSGATHEIELAWGLPMVTGFPVTITIDDQVVAKCYVSVDNWLISLWPVMLLAAGAAWVLWRFW